MHEPTREQAAEIVTFGHALQFAGFPVEDITAPNTLAASALALFDQEATSPLSDVASMDEAEIKDDIANWRFNGERPSIKWRVRLLTGGESRSDCRWCGLANRRYTCV